MNSLFVKYRLCCKFSNFIEYFLLFIFLNNIALRENTFEQFVPIFLSKYSTFKKGENRIKCLKVVYLCLSNYFYQTSLCGVNNSKYLNLTFPPKN